MKHLFSLFAVALAAISMNAQNIISVNSTVTEAIVITAAGEYTLQGDGSACPFGITVNEALGEVTLIADNINVAPTVASAGILINAGSTVTLKLKGDNILKAKTDNSGIEVWGNVIIESFDGSNTPTLTTTGSYAPGIGVNTSGKEGGDIMINSGNIKAIGGTKAPGIGNGTNKGATKVGNIIINGGIVDASTTSTSHAAGIGSGYYISGTSKEKPEYLNYASITINGGIVTAKGYGEASAIGCSKYVNGGNITINGGTVMPVSTNNDYRGLGGKAFAGKVIITGGSVNSMVKPDAAAVDGNEVAVAMNEFTTVANVHVLGGTITGTGLSYTLGNEYGNKDIYADAAGKVYFWLPSTVTDAAVNLQTTALDLTQPVNITAADTYQLIGTGAQTSNGINVAGSLGEVVLEMNNVNINATTALQIGAGTTVVLNGGNAQLTGAVAGDGKLVINGGTHIFKGTETLAAVEINGGSVKTLTAAGTLQGWTGVKNAAGTDLALFEAVHTVADTKIINGSVTGTSYEFDLKKENYGLTDVKTDAASKFYLYITAPVPADAVGLFNQLVVIDLTETGSSEVVIDAAGKYELDGNGTKSTGRVLVKGDLGNVYLNLNQVNIVSSAGAGILIEAGTTVYMTLTDSNVVMAGKTYYSGLIAEGDLVIDGPGILYAAGSTGSGIGGNHQGSTVGNITINGGIIYAKGSTYGAGIGLGYMTKNPNSAIIRINGGTIIATAGSSGAKPIGKGDNSASINVVVTGGNIRCLNSSKAETAMTNFTDTAGNALVEFKASLASATERTRIYGGYVGTIQLGTDYGMNDVYTLVNAEGAEGNVYFYLPEQKAGVDVFLDTKPGPGTELQQMTETKGMPKKVLYNGHLMLMDGQKVYSFDGMRIK